MPKYTHLIYHAESDSYNAEADAVKIASMLDVGCDDVTDHPKHVLRAALQGEWTGGMLLPKDMCKKGTEHGEQAALCAWANAMARNGLAPALALLWATPNGGERSKEAAAQVKAEGGKKGVPDLFLAHMHMHNGLMYGGLFIEMKRADGTLKDLSESQVAMIAALKEAGYAATTCFGWNHARLTLLQYLEIDVDNPKVHTV